MCQTPGLAAVKNGDMMATVYNDKEGQALQMLNLVYALATGSGMDEIELADGKYIRLPYSKITQDSVEQYLAE